MTDPTHIPFNRPFVTGREMDAIVEAIYHAHLSADGSFSKRCRGLLEQTLDCPTALLVHSCTAALELSALLIGIGPGDEIIMPSYTFVTTATAFVLRGATPVFVDIRADTLNLDERLIESAITDRTRAIVPVHYAGVACDMERINQIADAHSLAVIEDAAQGICATYRGLPLGTIGSLGAISFHETKNVICGHGGVLVVNDGRLAERAEILRDKGTNRSSFIRGQVDKYTWMDIGSSYAMSDLTAAFLWPQLQDSVPMTVARQDLWSRYHEVFADAEQEGLLRRPIVPESCQHNAHMYYLLMPDRRTRDRLIAALDAVNINAVFHYIPLHSSPGGHRFGRPHQRLEVTEEVSGRIVRLPLWTGMDMGHVERVADAVLEALPRSMSRVSARASF